MKGRQVVLGRHDGREAAALLDDGQLVDLAIDSDDQLSVGAICRGVAERLMKGQGGVFVRLPDGQRGYLRERAGLREGQPLLVQISGAAEDGKAIPLTSRLIFRGRNVLVTPRAPGINVSRRIRDTARRDHLTDLASRAMGDRDYGVILRSAAAGAEDADILAELIPLIDLADRIMAETEGPPEFLLAAPTAWEWAWTEWSDPQPDAIEEGDDAFESAGVLEALDALLIDRVPLANGASAFIQPTRALIAIDVNTGNDTSPAAALKANIALARDLPRQLRLRGLGGQIVIDFAPIPKRDRVALEQVLTAAFKTDGTETTLVGWTAMGLYEISRKRDRARLARLLGGR